MKIKNKKKNFITFIGYKIVICASFCILLLSHQTKANNLSISGVTINQAASTVTFSISWDNSWNTIATPFNWDAVWIFIKYKDCAAAVTTPFTHGALSGLLADRTIPATLEVMSTVNLKGTLNSSGLNTLQSSAVQAGALDFTDGIMLRKSAVGFGSVAAASVTLKIPLLPILPTLLNLSVIGIEMVYVPQGNFTIGDGNGATTAVNSHMNAATLNTGAPLTVTNAFETAVSTFYLNNEPAGVVTTIANVPAAWPKGQCGFYMMKHEISEGLYCQFLNTLSTAQYTARNPGNFAAARNRLQLGAPIDPAAPFFTNRPGRAQNYLNWADYEAFLDWACLRPPTETEFEKAARGTTVSSLGEYAWGNTNIVAALTFLSSENGLETFAGGNCIYNNTTFIGGDAGTGPARGGIFACTNCLREPAGASFYGVMELSGNVKEFIVALHSTAASDVYTRSWGNGDIDLVTGDQLGNATWPAANAVVASNATTNLFGLKGGSWNDAFAFQQVSDRTNIFTTAILAATRTSTTGGRGVR